MANELGAYELSDWEFAEAAYWFVKTKFVVEFLTFNSVSETLERGTGTCLHLNSVWVALCRAAGIKARYKTFNMMLPPSLAPDMVSERGRETAEMFNRGTPEVEGEICIDGRWDSRTRINAARIPRSGLPSHNEVRRGCNRPDISLSSGREDKAL